MRLGCLVASVVLASCGAAQAQPAAPTASSLAEMAARRFPQPVRVGDLLRRTVLQPTEAQQRLGQVQGVVRQADGGVLVVVLYGGVLGFGARPIAVPVEGVALLGEYLQVVGFTPTQLDGFASFDGAGTMPLPPDSTIRVGLAKPTH